MFPWGPKAGWRFALRIFSIAVAPLVSAGWISYRWTASVTLVETWPTSWLMSSSGTSLADRMDTNKVPRLPRGQLSPQPGRLRDLRELAADLPAVQLGAVRVTEHQVVILPRRARLQPLGHLARPAGAQRRYHLPGQLQRRRERQGVVSPLARTAGGSSTPAAARVPCSRRCATEVPS
jgi:hypothetical protein